MTDKTTFTESELKEQAEKRKAYSDFRREHTGAQIVITNPKKAIEYVPSCGFNGA